jgi:hypothetical protein
MPFKTLKAEAAAMQRLLKGKTVKKVQRHRAAELVLLFTDGTHLYIDRTVHGLEFSITGGRHDTDEA